jgi:hypothetical protein
MHRWHTQERGDCATSSILRAKYALAARINVYAERALTSVRGDISVRNIDGRAARAIALDEPKSLDWHCRRS